MGTAVAIDVTRAGDLPAEIRDLSWHQQLSTAETSAAHEPHRHLTVADVLPNQIGMAIDVEIGDRAHLPVDTRRCDKTAGRCQDAKGVQRVCAGKRQEGGTRRTIANIPAVSSPELPHGSSKSAANLVKTPLANAIS